MSEPEITPELIEQLKGRDERIAVLDEALAIASELDSSVVVKTILSDAAKAADIALEELADVDPTDTKKIIGLQAKVQMARFISQSLTKRLSRGQAAEAALRDDTLEEQE